MDSIVVSVENSSTTTPETFQLFQHNPNPFNPETAIQYTVGGTGGWGRGPRVKLAVYDMLGREVAVLVDERKAPGRYEVSFDGSGLSSGMYIYRLTAGSFSQSRKNLLVK